MDPQEGGNDPVLLRKADERRSWLESQAGVTRAISIIDVLKSTRKRQLCNREVAKLVPSALTPEGA